MELNTIEQGTADYARAARRIVWTLFAAQCLGSTALLAAATVNSIAGRQMTGSAAWATLPEAVYHLGTAAAVGLMGMALWWLQQARARAARARPGSLREAA
jgi:hypothetical protein